MENILYLFFLRLLDNVLNTYKTIYIVRGNTFIAASLTFITTFIGYCVIKSMSTTGYLDIAIISFSTFLGTYMTIYYNKKLEKDSTWKFDITPDNKANGKKFADLLRRKNFAIRTKLVYNDSKESVLGIEVYVSSKDQSELLKSMIPDKFNYLAEKLKEIRFND